MEQRRACDKEQAGLLKEIKLVLTNEINKVIMLPLLHGWWPHLMSVQILKKTLKYEFVLY